MTHEVYETTIGDKIWRIRPLTRKEYKAVSALGSRDDTVDLIIAQFGVLGGQSFTLGEAGPLAEEILEISGLRR